MHVIHDSQLDSAKAFFGDLVSPFTLDAFMQSYWQKDAVLFPSNNDNAIANLITTSEIDKVLNTVSIPINQVDIGSEAVGVSKASYQRGSYANPQKMLEHHKAGHSIILRSMQMWFPGLAKLTDIASRVFNSPAKANLYLTPAGHRSSNPHWDAHDIFVFQVAGDKVWDIHESFMQLPHPSYEFDFRLHPVGEKVSEISIGQGQVAYFPRGCVHNPRATTYSIHIALGVMVKTVDDCIRQIFDSLCRSTPSLRRSLPVKDGMFDRDECIALLEDGFRLLGRAHGSEMNSALQALQTQVCNSRRSNVMGGFARMANSGSIALGARVKLCDMGDAAHIAEDIRQEVRLNGWRYDCSTTTKPALEFLLLQRQCEVRELPLESDELKIAFVEALLNDGAVELCDAE